MAAKFSLVFLAALCTILLFTWQTDATIIRRDTPTQATDASKTLDEALDSLKTGLDDLVKNIQGNELFQNVTTQLKQFGESVQTQGKQLVDKIQASAKTD